MECDDFDGIGKFSAYTIHRQHNIIICEMLCYVVIIRQTN